MGRSFVAPRDVLQVVLIYPLHVAKAFPPKIYNRTKLIIISSLLLDKNDANIIYIRIKPQFWYYWFNSTLPNWNKMSVEVIPNEIPAMLTTQGSVIIWIRLHDWASSNGGVGYTKVWWTSLDPDGTTSTWVLGKSCIKLITFFITLPKIASNGNSQLKSRSYWYSHS